MLKQNWLSSKKPLFAAIVFCAFSFSVSGCSAFNFFSGASESKQPEASASAQAASQAPKKTKIKKAQDTSSTKKKTSKNASPSAANDDVIQKKLDAFGQQKIKLINEGLRPNKNSKEVTKRNGVYVARYIEVQPSSLRTRFRSNTANPPVKYVGFLQYQETHYESKGSTKEKALKGPFSVSRVRNMTEIILYDDRGWHD